MTFDPAYAADRIIAELMEARRRMDLGEPMSTTAAELGLTPSELQELLNAHPALRHE